MYTEAELDLNGVCLSSRLLLQACLCSICISQIGQCICSLGRGQHTRERMSCMRVGTISQLSSHDLQKCEMPPISCLRTWPGLLCIMDKTLMCICAGPIIAAFILACSVWISVPQLASNQLFVAGDYCPLRLARCNEATQSNDQIPDILLV